MSRIDTSWDIASMADKHPFWNRAAMQLVGKAVRANRLALVRYLTVSKFICVSRPKPAIIGATLVNGLPELLFHRHRMIVISDITFWLAFYYSVCSMTLFRNWRKAAASAHAQAARIRIFGQGFLEHVVSDNKLNWLPLDIPSRLIRVYSQRCRLSASAHADTAWVWADKPVALAFAVAHNVAQRFALYPANGAVSFWGNLGLLAASAMTKSIGYFECVHRCNHTMKTPYSPLGIFTL